jgi:glucose 1-dehydrogenase
MNSLDGKTAVVTGAGTAIGKAIAIDLADHGANVLVNYHSSADGAIDTANKIEMLGGKAFVYKADISNRVQVDEMFAKAAEVYGGIDILINNAAVETHLKLLSCDEDHYDWVMNTNLVGTFQCTQAVISYMKQQPWGRIVMISSLHAKRPTDFDPVYSMTKGGMKMLIREAAIELAPYGITVNAVVPGCIEINKERSGALEPSFPTYMTRQPKVMRHREWSLTHIGRPDDVSKVVSFVVSEDSAFITGASIRVDGGLVLL